MLQKYNMGVRKLAYEINYTHRFQLVKTAKQILKTVIQDCTKHNRVQGNK